MYKLTPQQQAEQLFDKMKGFRVKHSHSRKCAKIAVENIIATINLCIEQQEVAIDVLVGVRVYWRQVEKELDKCGKQ